MRNEENQPSARKDRMSLLIRPNLADRELYARIDPFIYYRAEKLYIKCDSSHLFVHLAEYCARYMVSVSLARHGSLLQREPGKCKLRLTPHPTLSV
jgi:hypothetical protein